jgi:CBS domain-containing protein
MFPTDAQSTYGETMSTVRQVERQAADRREVVTIAQDASAAQAATALTCHCVGVLVVLDDRQQVVGILSERDIVGKIVAVGRDGQSTLVREIMVPGVVDCHLDMPVEHAQQLMNRHHIRHLPVVEAGRCVGMLSSRDILHHELAATRELARRQCKILTDLERQHPGITQIQMDAVGRVVI